ncbi:MAG: transaldolase [Chloroflexi bacterium]|nr:transaldolase [Chloroflexota bacterium]
MVAIDIANAVQARDKAQNPLVALTNEGQSVWLDNLTRELVNGPELRDLIEHDGLRGMTSNPTIFQKAIAAGHAYDEQLKGLVGPNTTSADRFEALAVKDVQTACDVFRPVYDALDGKDGFVSLEVAPGLARNPKDTVTEARRLWKAVNRPNVMIKVPGTVEGAEAIGTLLQDGININVTLLFSLENHERVMWKYIEALEARVAAGQPINRLDSVASFFVSRVDTLVDKLLDEKIAAETSDAKKTALAGLKGKAAIANAQLAYARFREIFAGDRFQKLQAKGARFQRPLWASTSTKNPSYRDVMYVEELVGPDTVNTMPQATIDAFRDHGNVSRTVDTHLDAARDLMAQLKAAGIDIQAVTTQLEKEGIEGFSKSYADLIADIEKKSAQFK